MELTRNATREKIIAALYSCLIQEKAMIDYDIIAVIEGIFGVSDLEELDLFTKEVYLQALKHQKEIIDLIQPKLVKWDFSRLNDLAQCLFLEAVAENYFCHATPKGVVINFAVDYAKKYLDNKDYKYINAVLDKVLVD